MMIGFFTFLKWLEVGKTVQSIDSYNLIIL